MMPQGRNRNLSDAEQPRLGSRCIGPVKPSAEQPKRPPAASSDRGPSRTRKTIARLIPQSLRMELQQRNSEPIPDVNLADLDKNLQDLSIAKMLARSGRSLRSDRPPRSA